MRYKYKDGRVYEIEPAVLPDGFSPDGVISLVWPDGRRQTMSKAYFETAFEPVKEGDK